ncbi:VOC family protein [Streptomyces triticagri]|uniref:VOC family protein n=1 Tax=Streptomyces triticagri TaxID=2293568 RepID=A0A372MDS4_9ACTN|nr:VOC family protein [Streptomyces triticagri]RFU88553.1 VOC family protein [Streptomyces triticagri]RFU88637.1 VOC family protein [Streptomyces triticagri]
MSVIDVNQPDGTPTWIDLDLSGDETERAQDFYGSLFGWEFRASPERGPGHVTCLLRGGAVAGFRPTAGATGGSPGQGQLNSPPNPRRWRMYFAADDCDAASARAVAAGGSLTEGPHEVDDLGRLALVVDPQGAEFGLWQGRRSPGCELVNEPDSLVRQDLVTPDAGPARAFYPEVFTYTLDRNDDLPDFDFTFLRRPDGHEIGGIFGNPGAEQAAWHTVFEVADADRSAALARAAGGEAGAVIDSPYGRTAEIVDPLGTAFGIIARPPAG